MESKSNKTSYLPKILIMVGLILTIVFRWMGPTFAFVEFVGYAILIVGLISYYRVGSKSEKSNMLTWLVTGLVAMTIIVTYIYTRSS